mmetsp:Transcript_19325/g.32093  ORF Transcript_19325/g.32093 Transcript_19325/m.32093 type:complete len:475 (+) Transcript_19325:254-1678(+)|eukprot:CAMPEP_0119011996 /NCGR_PEP_ID=MMETSP1176-20130426/6014_1 /TAXON_ID=265551 /ORGANISM="Synedropsis recta cf, Strain CCMP1620" /LENGTH=474 /DNA_ID=CAMNT_0006964889 /DNA_START=192 /DNA_END=1616 /DNA_ORIENTATION=+
MTAPPAAESSAQQQGSVVEPRAEASTHMAVRHAAAVAAASIEKKLASTSSTSETVHLTRHLTELQRCSLQSELGFLDALMKMTNDEKLRTLFSLFDADGSGSVDKNELARNLKKLDQRSFSESLDAAILSIHAFDSDGDGQMDIHEFADFMEDLVSSLKCSFEDLAQFLTLRVAFCDSGSAVLDEAIVALVQDSTAAVTSVEDFNDAVVEVRMMLLFQMMAGSSNSVSFEIIVKSLYHVTQKMDEIPRKALLMCTDSGEERVLDYPQFSSLLLNVVAAGSLNFHDVANSMTLAFCKDDVSRTDLTDLFVGDDMYRNAIEDPGSQDANRSDVIDALQYGRMSRLFDLWDIDHSGDLDFEEVVLGFRKFHEAKSVDQTLEESIATIRSFDSDADGTLSREEFARLVICFAKAANVSSHELIDFMVVTSAVKDNSTVEKAYIKSVKDRTSEDAKPKKGGTDQTGGVSIGGLWKNLRS